MKTLNKITSSPILHPLAFAVFPILALWATNSDRMQPLEVVFPLALSLACGLVLLFILRLALRNWLKAGLLTSLAILLFFSYGHIFGLVKELPGIGTTVGRHHYLGSLWLIILFVGGYFFLRSGKKAAGLNRFLNRFSLILLVMTIAQLLYAQYLQTAAGLNHSFSGMENQNAFDPSRVSDRKNLPDIYLIVLDGYGRNDIIFNEFNFDNRPFLKDLTDLGFVIPNCTMANYAWTAFSMSSLLNMNYIDTFCPNIDPNLTAINYTVFTEYIHHSLVRKNLSELGYKTISFKSVRPWVEIPDADIFYSSTTPGAIVANILDSIEFHQMLSDTTALKIFASQLKDVRWEIFSGTKVPRPAEGEKKSALDIFLNTLKQLMRISLQSNQKNKYNAIMSSLDHMEKIANVPGPKFVYLHILAPHPPQIFGPNGEFMLGPLDSGYKNAVMYLNKRMYGIVNKIIDQSRVPPVIILQGDHGPRHSKKENGPLYNLNAYYLPGEGGKLLYPSITPVNSFRIIFNAYFGAKYDLLKDIGYLSRRNRFYDFQIVPPNCPPN